MKKMDNSVLKKRLNTYKTSKGTLSKVSDEVVMDVLRAWENWPGTSADLYRDLGLSKMQLVTMIQKAKRLVKSGIITESEFKEIKFDQQTSSSPCGSIEIVWNNGQLIKFSDVTQLIEFLKKAA